eukprot:2586548-Pyramimonas_sp.AAC.1
MFRPDRIRRFNSVPMSSPLRGKLRPDPILRFDVDCPSGHGVGPGAHQLETDPYPDVWPHR